MNKKLKITLGLVVIASQSCLASWYVGAGFGPETANFAQHATISQPGNFFTVDNTNLSGLGLTGSAILGYGKIIFDNIYLGAEGDASVSSTNFVSSNYEFIHQNFSDTTYRMGSSFGVSVLPGILLADRVLFFGRLGYENGNFSTTTSDSSLANISKNLDAFRWGIGVEGLVNNRVSLRVEYGQSYFESASMYTLDTLSNTTKITHITPQTGRVTFAVIYNFA